MMKTSFQEWLDLYWLLGIDDLESPNPYSATPFVYFVWLDGR